MEKPRLVLHFDVNKTILVDDKIQKIDASLSCSQILYWTSWGHVSGGRWRWNGEEPSLVSADRGAVLYGDYVQGQPELRKRRFALKRDFVKKGNAGEGLGPFHQRLMEALALPESVKEAIRGQGWAQVAGLDEGNVRLLPSFFELLMDLKAKGREVTLVIRTYGGDIPEIVAELNAFCEGRHPMYPGAALDGRDGGLDLRIDLGDARRYGAVHRGGEVGDDASAVSLALGVVARPGGCDSAPFANPLSFYRARAAQVLERPEEVWGHLEVGGAFALRDDYPWWARSGFKASAGKPLRVDPSDRSVHAIFFDDNVFEDDARIVDVRDARTGAPMGLKRTRDLYLVRADSYRAVLDRGYFIEALARCEAARAAL